MTTIRPAERTDLPAIHQLVRALARYEKAEGEFVATLEDYYAHFDEGVFQALVAEQNGSIAGMALYYMTYSTWKGKMLYLEDFVVAEPFRRQGIGGQLFDAFLSEARRRGCALAKWQVLDWNAPAVEFYKKKGAIIEQGWWNGKIFL
ncbi:GNAT family N-acetyltransferase [Phaeodactylibacter luteus]|uniref:GNAT family N-acetyltransferase n=1 Tax=Phaeodactylibacter luteus TaxID=1564516 RepID=A0A5C6S391_9BACT|nr:GNAT family N-acetyltransferase [Phaeodactylibacter luteus]TXB68935.1 GNAT family N-acetyltransferase [Phaeodactylibacter luteus]